MFFTLLTFVDKYYEYKGDKDPEEKGLMIGLMIYSIIKDKPHLMKIVSNLVLIR